MSVFKYFTKTEPGLASFPGPAQLFVACSTVIATESWAGPGNEAKPGPLGSIVGEGLLPEHA